MTAMPGPVDLMDRVRAAAVAAILIFPVGCSDEVTVQDAQLKPGLLVPTVQRFQSLQEIQKLGAAFGDDMLPIIHRHFRLFIGEGEGAPA